MDEILDKVLLITKLSVKEKSEFKESFYNILLLEIVKSLENSNPSIAEKLKSSLKEIEREPDRIKEIVEEAYSNPETKEDIDTAVKKVTSELTGLIDHYATDEQKRQILQH